MEVARLRSCYSVPCVFFQDGTVGTLQWYFVPEGTPVLPFGTTFQSDFWSDGPEGESWPLGEVPGAVRTWTNGLAPYPVQGGPPCGTADQFANGDPRPLTPVLNVYGGLQCCPPPPGLVPFFGCARWPSGVWSVYTLIVAGGTGQWAVSNGTYVMTFSAPLGGFGGCCWAADRTFNLTNPARTGLWFMFELEFLIPEAPALWIQSPGTNNAFFYSLANWNPFARTVIPVSFQFGPDPTTPPSVTIIPGFPSAGPPPCPNLQTTFGAYQFSTLPVVAERIQIRPRGGTWPLEVSGQCVWSGMMAWTSGTAPAPTTMVPTTLTVSAGGVATLTIRLSAIYFAFADLVYVSNAGWNGADPIACMLTTGANLLVAAPFALTLQIQGT